MDGSVGIEFFLAANVRSLRRAGTREFQWCGAVSASASSARDDSRRVFGGNEAAYNGLSFNALCCHLRKVWSAGGLGHHISQ